MRILVVLSRVPYPLEKGDKLRAYHMIKELAKDHEIMLFCLSDRSVDQQAEKHLKLFCSEVYIHRLPWFSKLFNLLRALFSERPFQVEYFYSRRSQDAFNTFLEAHLPQHIICQLLRTAEYVKPYRSIPKTLDYMDAFSAGMERMAGKAQWPVSSIMKLEQRRLRSYEEEVASHFEHLMIISDQDRRCLDFIDRPIHVVQNGIDPSFFEGDAVEKTRDVLFCGNMAYRPNVESARFLVEQVMPIVWKEVPHCSVSIAGASPVPAVKQLASNQVEVTGWIEDIKPVYRSAKTFVAPMLINSGLQNKLLEAMASGVPCVTTSLANNALGASPGSEVLIGDEPDALARQIILLLTDPEKEQNIAKAGCSFVKRQFSWENEGEKLQRILHLHG